MNNLSQGKSVCVSSVSDGVLDFNCQLLTNGATGELSRPESWLCFDGGISVELKLDFGAYCAVDGFDIGFMHDRASNIYCPDKVEFLLSTDGESFYLAKTVFAPYPASFGLKTRAVYSARFNAPFGARFAKLKFGVENLASCDEWRVYGCEAIGTETEISSLPLEPADKNSFADRDLLGGCTDLAMFTFADLSEQGAVTRRTYADFISCLAYLDENGKAVDVLFDSVALCLSPAGSCPSGGCLTSSRAEGSSLSDWEWLIDELFAKDSNLKALDTAALDVKSMLGLPRDYKFKAFLSAPVPKTAFGEFGDMNGDGIGEKLLTSEDCISAFAWYVDAVSRRFDAECLQNVSIEGFVWGDNRISRLHRDNEEAFATGCVSLLKNRGYKSIFVPSYMADGCERAEDVGFDCTAMQYNGESERFLSVCKKYGFGVCFTVSSANNGLDSTAFAQQLVEARKNGMMTDTVHIFNNANLLCGCAFPPNNPLRGVYDDLYKFIKGSFGLEKSSGFEAQETDICEFANTEDLPDETPETEFTPEPEFVFEPLTETEAASENEADEEPAPSVPETVDLADLPEEVHENPESEIKIRIEIEPQKTGFESIPDVRPPHRMPPPPPPSSKPCCLKKECARRAEYKRYVSIGVGVAAAVGAVYIISKIAKGDKNG